MQLHVRSLQKNDLKAVLHIAQCTEYNSWTDAVFADCLKDPYINWVFYVTEPADIIGFLIALVQDDECQLMNIAIHRNYWRLGYGDQLMMNLIETLKKNTIVKRIFLEVRSSNAAAIALYKKNRFLEVGRRKGYYLYDQAKEDALVFCLELD